MKKFYYVLLAVICLACGCGSNVKTDDKLMLNETNLIYEEELSPNAEYIENAEDKVVFNVKIYQVESNDIIVCASSNSAFFDDMQYEITYDKEISETDINIAWTTNMGSTEDAEDDQYVLADIAISSEGEVFSERKINFAKGAMEIVVDILEKNN